MADELKPCPMCGNVEIAVGHVRAGVEWWAADCEAERGDGCGLSITRGTRAAAIAAWNTRPEPVADEPVAFRYLNEVTEHMYFYAGLEDRWSPKRRKGWTETPLYTRPSTPPAVSDQVLVERIVEAVIDSANLVAHDGYYEIDQESACRAILTIIRECLK